jgi:molybdopterin synthase catalytic subunit
MLSPGMYSKQSLNLFDGVNDIQKNVSNKNVGAIVTFIGVSKESSTVSEKKVKSVTIESYKEEADRTLQKICDEIKQAFSLIYISIIHLEGDFDPTEPIVAVIIASKSRGPAFKALQEAVERYKKEPPIFKKENYTDGSSKWIT